MNISSLERFSRLIPVIAFNGCKEKAFEVIIVFVGFVNKHIVSKYLGKELFVYVLWENICASGVVADANIVTAKDIMRIFYSSLRKVGFSGLVRRSMRFISV